MMSKTELPVIAAKSPAKVELEPGKYYWCACGLSKGQPFCDGSHASTQMQPLAFQVEEKKQVDLCACKHTGRAPYCDGTHKKL
jgi:CDGSH iron-sulfur domain-containing protein 3